MPDIMEEITKSLEVEDVKAVLSSFKNENSLKENVDAMVTEFNSKTLEATVKYLHSLTTYPSAVLKLYKKKHNRVKPDIAKEIANFCSEISPVTCKKCSADYVPCNQHLPDKVSVCCSLCDRAAHKECFAIEAFDIENGIVFMCSSCLKASYQGRMETVKLYSEEQEATMSHPKEMIKEPINDHVKPRNNNNTLKRYGELISEDELHNDENQRNYYKRNICPQYMLGICKFGLVGRECPFEHPKHCRRWCSYGNTRFGCKRGEDCYFAHPLICEDSEKIQACMDLRCPRIHLAGTKRPPRNSEENMRNSTGNMQGRNTFKDNPRGRSTIHSDVRRVQQPGGSRGNNFNPRTNQQQWKPNQYQKSNYKQTRNASDSRYKENPRNNNFQKNIEQRNQQSQEVTVDFLGKCLEGIQENLLKQMNESITAAIQKQFIITKQAQAPMIPFNLIPQEQQTNQERPQTFIIRPH